LKILVVTHGLEDTGTVIKAAATLSQEMDVDLHVAYIWALLPRDATELLTQTHYETQEEDAQQALDAQVEEIEAAGGTVAEIYLRMGSPEAKTVELSWEIGADMLIVGHRRLGTIRQLLLGSEVERIVRRAPCPVLVVRQEDF
jgi:nucleotide-binding universal stress UspA family protein